MGRGNVMHGNHDWARHKPYLYTTPLEPHVLYKMYKASTSFSRKEGEMKSGGAIIFFITQVE
jgi:hypothetical protein